MAAYIHHIETVVPKFAYQQTDIAQTMKANFGESRKEQKLIGRIYAHSGIETRHSVLRDLTGQQNQSLFFTKDDMLEPSTKVRNDLYAKQARELFVCAAHNAIARAPKLNEFDITHVITVSCTGFFAPGPDYFVLKDLGLDASVQRYHVGFMGCYAAFPALKMAQAFCEADENAVVLVICVELCTLHLQAKSDTDSLIAASVFADGGAAAIVSAKAPQEGSAALKCNAFRSALVPEGESEMAWTIGDTGFDMTLSTYVPRLLETNLSSVVQPLLKENDLSQKDINHWAIHPGGRAILDKVSTGLDLSEQDLGASRGVLRNYGNMSSATILFVLKEILETAKSKDQVYAAAFGPGLSIESGLFSVVD